MLGAALNPSDPAGDVPLAPEVAERIAAGAYARWRGRRLRRLVTSMGVAAALALAAVGLQRFWHVLGGESSFATTATAPFQCAVGGEEVGVPQELRAKTPFTTRADEVALVRTREGVVAAMAPRSTAVFSEGLIELKQGSVMVLTARGELGLRAGPAEGTLVDGSVLVMLTGSTVDWAVYGGGAVVRTEDDTKVLTSGQQISWQIREREFGSVLKTHSHPPWAKAALKLTAVGEVP